MDDSGCCLVRLPPVRCLAEFEGFLNFLGSAFSGSKSDVVSFFRIGEMDPLFSDHVVFKELEMTSKAASDFRLMVDPDPDLIPIAWFRIWIRFRLKTDWMIPISKTQVY